MAVGLLQHKLQIFNDLFCSMFTSMQSVLCRALQWLSERRPGFNPRPIRVGFVVYEVTVILVRLLRLSSVTVIPPTLHTHASICQRGRELTASLNNTHIFVSER